MQVYLEPLTLLPELLARRAVVEEIPPRALPSPRGPSGEEVQSIVAAELQSAVAGLMDAQVTPSADERPHQVVCCWRRGRPRRRSCKPPRCQAANPLWGVCRCMHVCPAQHVLLLCSPRIAETLKN